jgi:hypothetical protein
MATIKDLQKAYAPMGLETINEDEDDRFEHIRMYGRVSSATISTISNGSAVSKQEGKERQRRRGHRTVWKEPQDVSMDANGGCRKQEEEEVDPGSGIDGWDV